MEIKLDEVEYFGLFSMFFGLSVFCTVCFWDQICGVEIAHHKDYGWMQIFAMGGSGIYSLWAYMINRKWNDYRKMIHNLERNAK